MTKISKKKTIYLAGPINNCNGKQIHAWREEIKHKWGETFDFIDPSMAIGERLTPYDVVRRDLEAIRVSDALVANMWRESVGTALGVAQAARSGKPVVIIDPNNIQSRMLNYYAIAVKSDIKQAIKVLVDFFKSRQRLRQVVKHGGEAEAFDVLKIFGALQRACREADQDDLLAPKEIIAEVVPALVLAEKRIPGEGMITSTAIKNVIADTLEKMSKDREDSPVFERIHRVWLGHEARKRRGEGAGIPKASAIGSSPQRVRLFSGKSHASIWGKAIKSVGAVPGEARQVFEEMMRVRGIAEIRLTKKSTTKSRWKDGVRVELAESTTPHVIEGKLYDNGRAGKVQMFQINVQDPQTKGEVHAALKEVLRARGFLLGDAC